MWEVEYLREEFREDNDSEEDESGISEQFKQEVRNYLHIGVKLSKIESQD